MKIHERALVHPKAKIGEGTVVGPDAFIDEHVEIGPDCEIRARAYITGYTKLGARNQVGVGTVIGTEPQDLGYKGEKTFIEIGDDNVFREYSTVHRGTKEGTATKIGNKNLIMVGAHIAHNCLVGNNVILVNNVLLAGYVEVHDHAFLGGDAVVHQFTRIGKYVMVRGQTRLGCDVPPYFMAVDTNIVHGLNRVGLKRAGFDQARRRAVQKAYNHLYFENKNRMQAIEALKTDPELKDFQDIKDLVEFLETTKRGICRPSTASGPSEGIED